MCGGLNVSTIVLGTEHLSLVGGAIWGGLGSAALLEKCFTGGTPLDYNLPAISSSYSPCLRLKI